MSDEEYDDEFGKDEQLTNAERWANVLMQL